jgi:hypothetical protein
MQVLVTKLYMKIMKKTKQIVIPLIEELIDKIFEVKLD